METDQPPKRRKVREVHGVLEKCSGGDWRRRYFVLSVKNLSYFRHKQDKRAKGSLNLCGGKVFLEDDDGERGSAQLSVISADGASYLLAARRPESAKQWLHAINAAIASAGRRSVNGAAPTEEAAPGAENRVARAAPGEGESSSLPLLLVRVFSWLWLQLPYSTSVPARL